MLRKAILSLSTRYVRLYTIERVTFFGNQSRNIVKDFTLKKFFNYRLPSSLLFYLEIRCISFMFELLAACLKDFYQPVLILTCIFADGDVDFQPEAIIKLVDLMKRNPDVGASCGRIHPIGSGSAYFSQYFVGYGSLFFKSRT